MIGYAVKFGVDSLSGRKDRHPNCPATQILLGTIVGDSAMKRIKLTKGQFALVDNEDFDKLNQWKWQIQNDRRTFYARTRQRIGKKRPSFRMHRVIMKAKKGQQIDHRDGNGLNNQKSNLRFCTRSQNHMNEGPRGGTSKFKGVSWHKRIKKWTCQIKSSQRQRHIGYFDNEIEAAKAYDRAAIELFGEFARPNFPKKKAI